MRSQIHQHRTLEAVTFELSAPKGASLWPAKLMEQFLFTCAPVGRIGSRRGREDRR
ncbi:hypothetical protein SBBP2_70003 [Burkholderiales bacterium]|nr:hypothetical protein SBBP2_70003 [Burkholderiales bacterium]